MNFTVHVQSGMNISIPRELATVCGQLLLLGIGHSYHVFTIVDGV